MSNFTKEQQLAINLEGSNIMVSAGAGSGKTTVLKTRVLRELKKENVNINNLIILTFTNNAANEMKERIRKIILENKELKEDAELLDLAYITTFDSFTGSLVRKYSYLLNISPKFNIIDSNIVDLEIDKIIDTILDKYYQSNNEKFKNFISDYCIKNDTDIRISIKKLYHKLCSLLNKDKYLDDYIENNYTKDKVEELFLEYENIVMDYVSNYIDLLNELDEYSAPDTIIKNNVVKSALENISSFDEIEDAISLSTVRYSEKAYDEEAKNIKDKIKDIKTKINKYVKDSKATMIDNYMLTKNNVEIIIDIIKELDKEVMKFKNLNNSYEFNDIAFKAIELVENNEDVRNELKNNTYEIMIDEYQDTNDIQEKFISLIENNNVYMVGDIKQSIYRFRNANPYIFKNKYDKYKDKIDGVKIDLNKNFRSRSEVIDDINLIFSNIMTDKIGGANYKKDHQMIFGKENYNKNILNDNYNMLIYNYDNQIYKNPIYEATIIADDILKRLNKHEMITYEENNIMYTREISYKDFVILVDKSSNFTTLKKVLEGRKIPATICKDIDIKDEDEIYILKNIINLIIKIKNNIIDNDFKHYYLSIGRSFLFNHSDNELYDIIKNDLFKNTDIYKIASSIIPKLDGLSNRQILNLIVEKFGFVNKLITTGDVEERLTKIEYLINNSNDLNDFGFDIYSLSTYLENIINSENDIKLVASKNSDANVVKIMTIHSSKGLEYPYVYMPYLNSSFKGKNIVEKFYFLDNKIILPFNNNGLGDTFTCLTAKYKEAIETISEKIRLFYVGATRAKEKIILISSINDKEISTPTNNELMKAQNYNDLLSLIYNKIAKYIYNLDKINFDANAILERNYKSLIHNSNSIINVKELKIENKVIDNKHFSKSLKKVLNKDIKDRLDFGTYMHYIFEVFDFKNGDIKTFPIEDDYKQYVTNFLNHEEVKNIKKAKIYKEQEIYFKTNDNVYNGFIDLMLEYDDHIDIIDYKLSNLNSDEYKLQLNGYKEYVENKYNKKTNIYLYSIKKNIFKKL